VKVFITCAKIFKNCSPVQELRGLKYANVQRFFFSAYFHGSGNLTFRETFK